MVLVDFADTATTSRRLIDNRHWLAVIVDGPVVSRLILSFAVAA
jgi:hypothetical protein